ncbi:MAG: prepilin-type N-terminal cleavage/methylation domain-containing protein [Candidatus Binatia bacterium]
MSRHPQDRGTNTRRIRGLSLLEVAVAMGVSAIVLASASKLSATASNTLSYLRHSNERLSAVRNLLEYKLGSPCGQNPPCPDNLRCSSRRSALGTGVELYLLDAVVEPDPLSPNGLPDPTRQSVVVAGAPCAGGGG